MAPIRVSVSMLLTEADATDSQSEWTVWRARRIGRRFPTVAGSIAGGPMSSRRSYVPAVDVPAVATAREQWALAD